jgi:hypothetical protein
VHTFAVLSQHTDRVSGKLAFPDKSGCNTDSGHENFIYLLKKLGIKHMYLLRTLPCLLQRHFSSDSILIPISPLLTTGRKSRRLVETEAGHPEKIEYLVSGYF